MNVKETIWSRGLILFLGVIVAAIAADFWFVNALIHLA